MKFNLLTFCKKTIIYNSVVDCDPYGCWPIGERYPVCSPGCGGCSPNIPPRDCYPREDCTPWCDPRCNPNYNNCVPMTGG